MKLFLLATAFALQLKDSVEAPTDLPENEELLMLESLEKMYKREVPKSVKEGGVDGFGNTYGVHLTPDFLDPVRQAHSDTVAGYINNDSKFTDYHHSTADYNSYYDKVVVDQTAHTQPSDKDPYPKWIGIAKKWTAYGLQW